MSNPPWKSSPIETENKLGWAGSHSSFPLILQNIWVRYHFWSNKIFGQKNVSSHKLLGPKTCGSTKISPNKTISNISCVQKLLGPKVEQKMGLKIYHAEKNLGSKNNDHPLPFHYGSRCILELWITLYSLTIDYPVYIWSSSKSLSFGPSVKYQIHQIYTLGGVGISQ